MGHILEVDISDQESCHKHNLLKYENVGSEGSLVSLVFSTCLLQRFMKFDNHLNISSGIMTVCA